MSMADVLIKIAADAQLRGLDVKYYVFDEDWTETFWWRQRLRDAGVYVIE